MVRFLLENGADVTFKKMPNETTSWRCTKWFRRRGSYFSNARTEVSLSAMKVVKALVEKGA